LQDVTSTVFYEEFGQLMMRQPLVRRAALLCAMVCCVLCCGKGALRCAVVHHATLHQLLGSQIIES
jgi:hypothetical protein